VSNRDYLIASLSMEAFHCKAHADLAELFGDLNARNIYLAAEQSFADFARKLGEAHGEAANE
jgi:hypothetical protein